MGVKSESRSWYTVSLDLEALHLEFRHLLLASILPGQQHSSLVSACSTCSDHCSGQISAVAGFSHVDVLSANLRVAEVFLFMQREL